jgi:hypothetical protein
MLFEYFLICKHRLKFSWNDYFSGNSITLTLSDEYSSTQTLSESNVYVINCLFNNFTSGSNGGALSCTSATNLLVESSSFFSCKTSSDRGGAIFLSNNGGQCVLHGICIIDCCSTYTSFSYYQFAYVRVNDGSLSKNYINYSSIIRCINERTDSYYIMRLENAKICCPSVNISMNICQFYPGITTYPYVDSSSVTCSISYSSFVDNNANGNTCIYLHRSGTKQEMKCCNILRNTQVSDSCGIIYSNTNSVIEDSCILENTATNIFYVPSSSYSITLSNCTVDNTKNNQKLIIQNTVTKSFIHGLNHISTQNCHSEYDAAGNLTAVPHKKRFYYTYKRNHFLSRISHYFSLSLVSIFTFINPNPFIDC